MVQKSEGLFARIGRAVDEDWERGTSNLKEGLKKMFGCSSDNVEFTDVVDVLNYLLSEVPKGHCEIAKLTENDDYDTILNWVRHNKKGNKFYLVKGGVKSGEHALGVFFADDERVYAGPKDPKICYKCSVIPEGIKDLFGNKQIYLQHFK